MGIALYHKPWHESITLTEVKLDDTNASNYLTIDWSENDTSDRTFSLAVGGGNRTLTLNENFTIGDGNSGTLTFSGASKTLTVEDTSVVNQDLSTDASVTFAGIHCDAELDMDSNNIDNIKTATFIAEVTATPSAAFTVDWTSAQKQRVTITGTNLDITFTDPDGPCNLTLVVVQGDGNDTIDWSNEASILWPGGTAPTLSTGNGDVDVVSFYFDGQNYLGVSNLDFS